MSTSCTFVSTIGNVLYNVLYTSGTRLVRVLYTCTTPWPAGSLAGRLARTGRLFPAGRAGTAASGAPQTPQTPPSSSQAPGNHSDFRKVGSPSVSVTLIFLRFFSFSKFLTERQSDPARAIHISPAPSATPQNAVILPKVSAAHVSLKVPLKVPPQSAPLQCAQTVPLKV